ncbi:MAG: hypothetical protein MZW92_40075 [Comamonadaceae bacterium]|nr:hypothetical protein [Comamonadaceae bacterium]
MTLRRSRAGELRRADRTQRRRQDARCFNMHQRPASRPTPARVRSPARDIAGAPPRDICARSASAARSRSPRRSRR